MAVEDITTKTCTKCGEAKPLSGFSKHSRNSDGMHSWCKACNKTYHSEWRAANKDKLKSDKAAYHAANRDKIRAAKSSYRAANADKIKAAKAAYREANRDKAAAANAEWRSANRDKNIARIAAWKATNKESVRASNQNRRAKKRENGGKLSRGLAERLFKLQRGKCACCGKSLGSDYHLDHIMPLALGGSNTDDNIQLLRSECNLTKNAKHPVDYMQSKGFLL